MKINHTIPPVYQKCHEQFGVNWEDGIIITYGDEVYCKTDIPKDLEVHEGTHIRQQKEIGKDIWWDKYFNDKEFRLSQEVEAYQNQLNYLKEVVKDRNKLAKLKNEIWSQMANMYGDMCTFSEARMLVR